MKRELITELFDQLESACCIYEDVECWSARDLQEILGYTQWRNFQNVIIKARAACGNAGETDSDHFADSGKLINLPKGASREVDDVVLTRYACYLIAQNGDPTKAEVAFAQTYFAVQTRKQEIIVKRLQEVARVSARERLTRSEKKLSSQIYERGVDHKGFAVIRSRGDQALFGGFSTQEMKKKLHVPGSRPLADFLPTLTIKAKDFATELTSHNVSEKELHGQKAIAKEHIDNSIAVRKMLMERGVKPEKLPPEEDIKKIQRRLEGEEKQVLKEVRKIHSSKKK